jgi:transcription factor SPN1
MEIDTILKSNKASRPKKRKKEDDLDQFADAEVSQLREEMLNAAELDEQANREKLPATLKLKSLPKVMGALRKCVLCSRCLYGDAHSLLHCALQELALAIYCRQ